MSRAAPSTWWQRITTLFGSSTSNPASRASPPIYSATTLGRPRLFSEPFQGNDDMCPEQRQMVIKFHRIGSGRNSHWQQVQTEQATHAKRDYQPIQRLDHAQKDYRHTTWRCCRDRSGPQVLGRGTFAGRLHSPQQETRDAGEFRNCYSDGYLI